MLAKVKVLAFLVIFISSGLAGKYTKEVCISLADSIAKPNITEKDRIDVLFDYVRGLLPNEKFSATTFTEALRSVRDYKPSGLEELKKKLEEHETRVVKQYLESSQGDLKKAEEAVIEYVKARSEYTYLKGIATLNISKDLKMFYNKGIEIFNAGIEEKKPHALLTLMQKNLPGLQSLAKSIDYIADPVYERTDFTADFFLSCMKSNFFSFLNNASIDVYKTSSKDQIFGAMMMNLEFFEANIDLGITNFSTNYIITIKNYITIAGDQKSSITDKDFKFFMSRLSDKLFPYLIKHNEGECYVMFATTTYVLGTRQGSEGSSYMDFIAAYLRVKGLKGIFNHTEDLRRMFLFQLVAATSIKELKIDEEAIDRSELLNHIREVLETPNELIAKLKIYNNFGLYKSIFVDEEKAPGDFYVAFMESLNSYLVQTANGATLQDQHLGFDAYLDAAFQLSHGEYLLIKLFNAVYAVNNFELGNYTFEFKAQTAGFSSKACAAYIAFIEKASDGLKKTKWPKILTAGRSDVKGIKSLIQIGDEILTRRIEFITSKDKYTYKPTEVFIISQQEYDQLLSQYGTLEKLEKKKLEENKDFKAVLIKKDDGQIIDVKHNAVVGEKGELIEVSRAAIGMKPEETDEKVLPEGTQPEQQQPNDRSPIKKAKNRGGEEFEEPELFGNESAEKPLPSLDDGIKGKQELIGGKHDYNVHPHSDIEDDNVPLLGSGDHDEKGVKIGEKRQGGLLGSGDHDEKGVKIGQKRQGGLLGSGDHDEKGVKIGEKRQGGLLGSGDHDEKGVKIGEKRQGGLLGSGDHDEKGVKIGEKRKDGLLGGDEHDRIHFEIDEDGVPQLEKGDLDKIRAELEGKLKAGLLGKNGQEKIRIKLGEKGKDGLFGAVDNDDILADIQKNMKNRFFNKAGQDVTEAEIEEDQVPKFDKANFEKLQAEIQKKLHGELADKDDQDEIEAGLEKKSLGGKNAIVNKVISITIEDCNVSQMTNLEHAKKHADNVYHYFTITAGKKQEIPRSHFHAIFNACKEMFNMDNVKLLEEGLPEPEHFEGEVETGVTEKAEVSYTINKCGISTMTKNANLKDKAYFYFEKTEDGESKEVSQERFLEIIEACKEKGYRFKSDFPFSTPDLQKEQPSQVEEEKPELSGLTAVVRQQPETPRIEGGHHVVVTHHFINCYSSSSSEESSSNPPTDGVYTKYARSNGEENELITFEEFQALEDACYDEIKEENGYDHGFYKVIFIELETDKCEVGRKADLFSPAKPEGRLFEQFSIVEGETKRQVSREEWKAAHAECNKRFLVSFKEITLDETCGQSTLTTTQDRRDLETEPKDIYYVIKGGEKIALESHEEYEKEVAACLVRQAAAFYKPSIKTQAKKEEVVIPNRTNLKIQKDVIRKNEMDFEEFDDEFDESMDPNKFRDGQNNIDVDTLSDAERKVVIDLGRKAKEPQQSGKEVSPQKKFNKNKFEGENENDLEGEKTFTPKKKLEDSPIKPFDNEIDEKAWARVKGTIDNLSDEAVDDLLSGSYEKKIGVVKPKLDGELPTLKDFESEDEDDTVSPHKNRISIKKNEEAIPVPEDSIFTDGEVDAFAPREKLEKLFKGELSKSQNEKVMKDGGVLDIIRKDPAEWLRKIYQVSLNCRDCFLQFFDL